MLRLGRHILNGDDTGSLNAAREQGDLDKNSYGSESENLLAGFNVTPKKGSGKENIPHRVVSVIEILESDTGYSDLLAGLIDAFHDTVRTKKEIKKLRRENIDTKQEMKALKARITRLESGENDEKESYRKTA
jgi:hypothetical protein